MAQRIRNHIIEDESRLFFKQSLPNMWVCRDKSSDYGIDCEVEIFDQNGNSTGLVFWVQIKGTDSRIDKKIKKVSFKKKKIIQFLHYDFPVLIVRYSSDKKQQYVKWVSGEGLINDSSKSIYVSFYESEKWGVNTSNEIHKYLESRSLIKSGRVRTPITAFVGRIENNNENDIPYYNVSIIKQCLDTKKRYFNLTTEKTESILQIKVGKDFIITSFSDLSITTMSINFHEIGNSHTEKLTKHILITFSQALYDIGKNDIAEQVIFENDLIEIFKKHKEYLISILPNLLSGNNSPKVLEILNEFFKSSNDENLVAIVTQIILTANRSENNEKLENASEQFLKVHLDIARKRNNSLATATSLYNLGNFYRNTNNLESSLNCYLEARKFNNHYKNHHYYYYELAGVLFSLEKYFFSNLFYSKSISLKTDYPYAKALLAHSYVYLGKYQLALETLDQFLLENEEKKEILDLDEWQLWYSCLATLINNNFPSFQKRNKELSDKFIDKKEFENAVLSDLLNSVAWFNLGVESVREENNLSAFVSFCLAALINNHDIESWINATICGFNEENNLTLLIFTIRTAFHYNGYNYVNNLREELKNQNPENINTIIELIDKTIEPRKRQPTIVRFYNEYDDYETFEI